MAYDLYNTQLRQEGAGIQIRIPETVWGVSKSEISELVKSMEGHAVIKVPYSNAGETVSEQRSDHNMQLMPVY